MSGRAYLLVLAVALAASATSLRNGFVYDDVPVVVQDARIRTPGPHLLAVPYWSGEVRDRIYRPLTTVSFAVDWKLGRGSPMVFHATNVALHLLVVALVLALASRVLGPGAAVAALWFAVHPIHVEVVANVVGRSELLAAAGYLGAVLAWIAEDDEHRRRPGGIRRALLALAVLVCAAAAFVGKEHALTLPALLLLADLWRSRASGEPLRPRLARHALLWIGVLALAAGYLAARHAVLGTTFGGGAVGAGLERLGAAGRATVMAPAMLVWARLLIFPFHLSADYSPDAFVPGLVVGPRHVLGVALVIGALLAAWAARRRAPGFTSGIVWLALTAGVAANVVFPTGVMLAERVLYLPSVGAALAVGALWELLPRPPATWYATTLVLGLLAARTLERIGVWRDEERFYQALVRDAPASYRTHWARGARAFERRDPRSGEQEYLTAIRIHPDDAELVQELGERYLSSSLWGPADRFLTIAWRVDSLRSDAALQAVLARIKLGRPDSAVALGEEALRVLPNVPTLLLATGDAYRALGRPLCALALKRRAAFAAPRAWQYQYVAAEAAALAGRCDEARLRAERARAMAPDEPVPRDLLARVGGGPTCGVRSP